MTEQTGALVRNATIDGNSGADTIDGPDLSGNVLSGFAGDDLLRGNTGADFLFGGLGDDTLIGNVNEPDTFGDDGDFLQGGAGSDYFPLGSGDDVIHGFAPAGSGALGTDAGATDTIDASGLLTVAAGSGGITATFTGSGAVTISYGGSGTLLGFVTSFTGIEEIIGTMLDDVLTGSGGDETLSGGAGNDRITAGDGAGLFDGGSGDDTLSIGAGEADVFGGTGDDLLTGEALSAGARFTLSAFGRGTYEVSGLTGNFSGIETVAGSDFDDTVIGSASDDTVEGAGGDDSLVGGAGTDTALFEGRAVEAQFFLSDGGDVRVVSSTTGEDTLSGFERYVFADTTLTPDDIALIAEPEVDADDPDAGTGGDDGTERPDTEDPDDVGNSINGQAPVGDNIDSTGDPSIADVFFGNTLDPQSILFTGSGNAIGLLPTGYQISDGETAVFIESGLFLSTGGGPGTENTESSFTVTLGVPGDQRLTDAAQLAFPDAGNTNDASIVTFTFDSSQVDGDTIEIDLFFGSDEYPEFADSSFVDIAAVFMNGVNYALFDNDPLQPLSIVGDSINTPGNFYDNTDNTFDTEYDGFSALLTVLVPVQEGLNELVIGIADTGDAAYDSGLFVGDAEVSSLPGTGAFANVAGTGLDDLLELNTSPQIVTLNGGADTVSGTAAEFEDDIIRGWSDNDLLIFDEELSAETFILTPFDGGATIGIDANLNGLPERIFTVSGGFENASLVITEGDGQTLVRTVGVAIDPPVVLVGENRGERLFGGTGADLIDGAGGADTIAGDEGNDTILGGDGNDSVIGSSGGDRLEGGAGDDSLRGNDDGDIVLGGDGSDEIDGDDGEDSLFGGAGEDLIDGGAGSDTIGGGAGSDTIFGRHGDDFIGGGTGGDRVFGGIGADTIGAGDGNDFVVGGAGRDVIAGGAGNDELDGEFGDDVVAGSYGDDKVWGGRGQDMLGGGTGQDTILGGLGDDTIGAGEGDDSVSGGEGNDFVAGGGRNDTVSGGNGDDTLNGGAGSDVLIGGEGRDLFIWNGTEAGARDIIRDFDAAEDELIFVGAGTAADVVLTDVLLRGQSYAVMEIGGQEILFEGYSSDAITPGDFLFL